MKVEATIVEKMRISEIDNLDPIDVVFEDLEPKKGKVMFNCYGEAWSVYWVGMSKPTIKQFFKSCDSVYIAGKATEICEELVDYEGLGSEVRRGILKIRRQDEISPMMAREYFDECSEIIDQQSAEYHSNMISVALENEEWFLSIPSKANPKFLYLKRIIEAIQCAI